jgi:short-subunit dehydrogenase
LDETGVTCATAAIDLADPGAIELIKAAVGEREVGLYIANAGADPNGSYFLESDVEPWRALVQRNVLTTVLACHHFGALMRDRRRGGLLLVNSGACYGGSSFMACYTASKAFELNFAESLWAELREYDVDVLTLVLGMTDTPAFRKLLAEKGQPVPEAALASPADVAEIGLTRLPHGPVYNWGQDDDDAGFMPMSASSRRERVLAIGAASAHVFGER